MCYLLLIKWYIVIIDCSLFRCFNTLIKLTADMIITLSTYIILYHTYKLKLINHYC